jgi:hypothetical protein
MSQELKNILKEMTSGKKDPSYVMIKIREASKVTDVHKKEYAAGIFELRINTSDEKLPKQYTHAYLIHLANFGLNVKEFKKADQIKDLLLNPSRITHSDTKQLLEKLDRDFGGFVPDGGKYNWRTQNFKKQKDPFQIKRKAL